MEHLKDVRNNFFHGDKTAAERDIELLVAGIAVLRLMRWSTRDMAGLRRPAWLPPLRPCRCTTR